MKRVDERPYKKVLKIIKPLKVANNEAEREISLVIILNSSLTMHEDDNKCCSRRG